MGCTVDSGGSSPVDAGGVLDRAVADAAASDGAPDAARADSAVPVEAVDQGEVDAAAPVDAALLDAEIRVDASPPPTACEVVGERPLRRLTPIQFQATAMALGLPALPLDLGGDLAPEITQLATEKRLLAAAQLAAAAALEPGGLLPCDPVADAEACATQLQVEWADQLFRRPPTAAEAAWLAEVWDAGGGAEEGADAAADDDFAARARRLLEVLLASPQVVYRLPTEPLAARLAFTLTDGPPDAALRAADLADPAVRAGEAARLAASAAGRAKLRRFVLAWAGIAIGHKVEGFPRSAAIAESARFVDAILARDGTFAALLTSRAAALDAETAALYGVDAAADALPEGERAGILTRLAFLASHAGPVAKSPIQRGVFVRAQLLCSPLPPPPPTVDDSPVTRGSVSDDGRPRSIRELTERRTGGASCSACHQLINPPGFLFEHYDALGRFVREEHGVGLDGAPYVVPVDAQADVPGSDLPAPLADAVALSRAVAESDVALDCFAARWLAFALDRPLTPADACDLERLQAAFRAANGRLSALLTATAALDGIVR